MTWAPVPHVSKLKNISWNLYSVTIRLICGRCVVWHHIVGTTISFFDRFRSAYLASPEWTQGFLNVRLLVHRHRITMLIFKEPGTMVSSPHIAIKHDRHCDLFKSAREWWDLGRVRLLPLGLRSGHIPRAKEPLLTERCWKIVKMYASIQDAYSKLLHIKDGRCLDFLACQDVGYQHANFQKYRKCDKKIKRYLFESTFVLGHPVS